MDRRFFSFRSADLDPTKLRTVCSSYVAYDHARAVRKVLIPRLLLLIVATCAMTLGLHVLPTGALVTAVLLASACLGFAVRTELKAWRRFANELRDVPLATDPSPGRS
jgi:hypothetical protein